MPGYLDRVYVARCVQCLRGLYRKPDREDEGRCASCRRYNQKWARWEAQARQQSDHNREAHKRAARGSGAIPPEPAHIGGGES